jgi:transposase-like protein
MTTTDGAPGLIRAVEEGLPTSLRQRCLAHKMRNIVAKLPDEARTEVRQAARAAYEAPSPAMARALRDDLVERFGKLYPSAVQCFVEDFEACIAHLRLPPDHRRMTRTTNLLERMFVEERRRVRAVLHTFGERPVLKLMYAALVRGAERWRGFTVNDFERKQLERLRGELRERHRQENAPAVQPTRAPSRTREGDVS